MTNLPTQALIDFCLRLESAGIPYLVGGSVASSIYTEPRQTNDVDVEVWLGPENLDAFRSSLDARYNIAEEELRVALTSKDEFKCFQVLDKEPVLKFDCFIQGHSPIDAEAYEKARMVQLNGGTVRFACPEHILVQKLRWYQLGNRVSEQQWRDIQGIVRYTANLDWDLVQKWADAVGVSDLVGEVRRG